MNNIQYVYFENFLFFIAAPPVIILSGGSTVLLGGSIILTATISSTSAVTSMKWQKLSTTGVATDINIASASGKYAGSTVSTLNPKLVINNANYNDGSIYRLVVSNAAGETTSNQINLRIVGRWSCLILIKIVDIIDIILGSILLICCFFLL